MKSLKEFISIQESNSPVKDLVHVKKGDIVYGLLEGSSKVIKLTVSGTLSVPTPWNNDINNVTVDLEPNDLGLYYYEVYDNPNDGVRTLISTYAGNPIKTFWIAINKELLKEQSDSLNNEKLTKVLKRIAEYEKELADMYKEKQELERQINSKLTESLQNK